MSLVMLIPSRGRPESVARMAQAWTETRADKQATALWLLDADDPRIEEYRNEIALTGWMKIGVQDHWTPMVPKLNRGAVLAAEAFPLVGFMGDDHLPRTADWADFISGFLHQVYDPAIVYGRDGYQDERLPTWWVMSAAIVKALGRMVPAPVQHMYCDNSIMEMGKQAGRLHYLPDVYIEHMHPVAGKAESDEGYRRVNRPEQYDRDLVSFRQWRATMLAGQVHCLRELH